MIDVVFLLIIFFLVSSHLARRENHLPVDLPAASEILSVEPDKVSLTVTITDENKVYVAGRLINASETEASLQSAFASLTQDGKSEALQSPPNIRIRCDGTVPYRQLVPVLRAASEAGFAETDISVLREEE